jgi:hypothetical protein
MTFRHARTPIRIWLRDREGTEDATRLDFPPGLDKETVIDAVNTDYASVVQVLSDCRLCETNIEFFYIEEDPTPSGTFTREEAGYRGAFFFETDPDQRYVFTVPGIKPDLLLAPDQVVIDPAHADVQALISAIVNDSIIVSPFGVHPATFVTAYKRLVPIEDTRPTG